ncbi:outer membrane beta-barrel protein [Sphingomonas sp. T9W2]|uniref:outer membrane beta-barrel protein n=1 Tax=Sphingomonas sp. T9W2 TaxID=3143183 RepID=UPI0031F57C70
MKFQAAAVLAATMAFAQPAAAQVAPTAPQPYPEMRERLPRNPLQGLRIEATVGYDRLEGNYYEDDTKYYDGYDGIGFGGEIGYDFAVSRKVLLGAYAGIGKSTQKQCDEIFGGDELCQKAGTAQYAGVRVGFPMGVRSQLYLRGGYSNAKLKLDYDAPGTSLDFSANENYNGYHIGAGAEFGVGGGAYLKGDVAATQYMTKETLYDGVNFMRVQARVGIGVRF